jgi:hypothetical protein
VGRTVGVVRVAYRRREVDGPAPGVEEAQRSDLGVAVDREHVAMHGPVVVRAEQHEVRRGGRVVVFPVDDVVGVQPPPLAAQRVPAALVAPRQGRTRGLVWVRSVGWMPRSLPVAALTMTSDDRE